MTQTAPQSNQAILQLLADARKKPPAAPEETDVTDYDWHRPCRFTPAQIEQLQRFTQGAGSEMSAALCAEIHEDVELQPAPSIQCYAEQLSTTEDETKKYYISLTAEGVAGCGFVMVPAEQANRWVAKVLGGAAAGETDLSSLESAILTDIVESLVSAFNGPFQAAGGRALGCGKGVSSSLELPPNVSAEEYTILPFRTSAEAEQDVVQVALASDIMAPAAGADNEAAPDKSPQQIRKDIIARINQVEVDVEVWLGRAELTMREIMSLEEGDVLLTGTEAGQTIALTVEGATVLFGYPVQCTGRYGLQVAGGIMSHDELRRETG